MRSRENVLGVIILALLSLGAMPQTTPTAFKVSIEGTVRDAATKEPMAGVNVHVLDPSQRSMMGSRPSAVSDAQGQFRVEVTPRGSYRLAPERSGFVYVRPPQVQTLQHGVVVTVENDSVPRVNLEMVREGKIAGQILQSGGQPLPGLAVHLLTRLYSSDGEPSWGGISAFVQPSSADSKTNDRGEYRFYGLQPGDYLIAAGLPSSYYPGVKDLSLATPVHVDQGAETRVGVMSLEPPLPPVQVRYTFDDPEQKFISTTARIGRGNSVEVFFSSWIGSTPAVKNAISARLTPGRHELMLSAKSNANDLLFASVTLEVENADIQREVRLTPGIRVTGSLSLRDANGQPLNATGITCALYSAKGADAQSGSPGCIGGQYSPGLHRLSFRNMPPDTYVLSAKSGDHDVLANGLQIEKETQLDIVLSTPGTVIKGVVKNDKGERFSHAVVALVPDAPHRDAAPLYRSDITTYNGGFELRGIAPGAYRLYAWPDLPGSAYRNAEFMKKYEDKGIPVRIDSANRLTIDLTALD